MRCLFAFSKVNWCYGHFAILKIAFLAPKLWRFGFREKRVGSSLVWVKMPSGGRGV